MKKIILLLCLAVTFLNVDSSVAATTPLSIGIAPPVQFPSSDFTIAGLRTSLLWGRHRDLYGLDLGVLGNITDQDFVGVGLSGVFNWTEGNTTILGLQLAGLTNINTKKTRVFGVQAALGVNSNVGDSSVVGLQVALVNLSNFTDIYGVQVGVYNRAKEVYGFQIGIVNFADSLHGVQIGVINFHHKGLIGVSPIINIGF